MARIDGKYEVLEEKTQSGAGATYSVQADALPGAEAGELLRLDWVAVSTTDERNSFHRYRAVLKALAPAGLADVVARPGAYYSVWREVVGLPLPAFQAQSVKNEVALSNLRALAANLAAQGYALMDAEVVMHGDEPRVAHLAPAQRSPQDAESLNAAALAPLSEGKVRRFRRPRSVWSWLPGVACAVAAAYFGADAAQIYLNPALADVPPVMGKAAREAAGQLAGIGYRVQYVEGDERRAVLGAVIAQDPAPGSTLHLGRLVTLTVNNPPALTVPRFEEQTLDQVKASLAENLLKLGSVSEVDGAVSNTPKGRVVAQIPAPGSVIRRGQSVRLLISNGISVRQTWLPDLTKLTFDEARDLIRRAGLVVNATKPEISEADPGTVLRQSPAAYKRVDIGSPVTLVVAIAGYQGPAISVPPLPVPPVPVPVTPPATPNFDPNGTTDPAAQPEFAPDPGNQPSTAPAVPVTPAQPAIPAPAAPTPATSQPVIPAPVSPTTPATPSSTEIPPTPLPTGQVAVMSYTFPADLPAGSVEIVVRDDDGERTVLPATDSAQLAGNVAQRSDISVRGSYRFIVRLNGQEYTTFGP
ncbi:PASTA domain-containing protein [Deinococcus sp.]|uniref:PASTA domain-containing protein n=1 Tax=Deinococcus sp. TaxID=47478 RepID=UPI0025E304A6|nr:PASTA domain-containing protein [Deinococcus sp.]